jgi:nucleotide-binding universal stress UspA family protein
MENLNKPIIVPWDFTHVAENAFEYAVNIARVLDREIVLMHIVERKEDEESAMAKLKIRSSELSLESGIKTHSFARFGNIFETIREVAQELKAEMVIMGTHGRKGMQRVTGSWALKVMANSKVPFLVVQNKPVKEKFEKILFPIDFRRENKEKVNWMHYLSKNFNSTYVLYKRKSGDRGFKRRIASNLHYAESFLKNNSVIYQLHTSKGKAPFEKETISFAKENGIDLILILVTRDISFFDYFMAAREQFIISNPEQIPVLCINPKPARLASGFSASGG